MNNVLCLLGTSIYCSIDYASDYKWSCSLGYDLRMIYEIDDESKEIIVVAVGSHKVYQ